MRLLIFLIALVQAKTVILTVMYCPTYFSTKTAIVSVDTETADFKVVADIELPIGDRQLCDIQADPAVFFDKTSNLLYLDYIQDYGKAIVVDLIKGKVAYTITPQDPFFVGYISFYFGKDSGLFGKKFMRGLHPTVTQDGLCNDGCYQMETIYTDGKSEKPKNLVLYKALMDDVDFYHDSNNNYYVQMSYDLRNATTRCKTPNNSSLCLVVIDEETGAIKKSTYTDYTVYKFVEFGETDLSNITAFVEGGLSFARQCYQNNTETSYSFASVNLNTAEATFISCMDSNIVMDEWISSFSADHTQFATASGNAESADAQLLVADVRSGKTLKNVNINSLGQTLKAASGLFDVVSCNFID